MPSNRLRIIELEREVIDTRNAAVGMILGLADAIAQDAVAREELAKTIEEAAKDADPATVRLAKLVATVLRRRALTS